MKVFVRTNKREILHPNLETAVRDTLI